MTTIGGQDSINCSDEGASLVEWIYNGEVVAHGNLGHATLDIRLVNDSIHGRLYTCNHKVNLTIIVNGENIP